MSDLFEDSNNYSDNDDNGDLDDNDDDDDDGDDDNNDNDDDVDDDGDDKNDDIDDDGDNEDNDHNGDDEDNENENDDDDDENSAGCGDILQPPNRKPQVRVPQPTLETDHINATNPKCKAGKYSKFGIRAKIWPPKLTIFDTLG